METFQIITGLTSIASLVFAAVVYHKKRTAQAREEGNVKVFSERLKNIDATMRAAMTILQIIIRRADDKTTPVTELQNVARAVRAALYGALVQALEFDNTLREWKFGQLLQTTKITGDEPENIFEQHRDIAPETDDEHGISKDISTEPPTPEDKS